MNEQDRLKAKIILCLDFDGTLTNREGSGVVFSPFYKSLQVDENSRALA